MRRFQNLFRRLWKDRSGNFAAILAISMIPIVAAVGASVDISRAYVVENRLKAALDASALAIGGSTGLSAAQMQAMAQSYFNANYPASKIGVPGTLSVTQNGNVVSLSVSADMPTALMGVVGIDTLNVVASTEVTRMGKKLEVVLVLDNTGSMNSDGRMTVLKSAAKDLITTVSSAAVSPGDVKIAIVPFTTDVNVGTSYKNSNWLKWSWELPTETCVTTGNWNNRKTTCTQDVRTVTKSSWKGCVVDRDQNYDVSIADPVTVDAATLFPANDNNLYNNNCTLRAIVPFSTDWTMLKNEIDAMVAGGATNTTIGFVWGWQMLINGKVLSNAAAKDPEKLEKVMVYLTDGDNTYYREGIGSCNGSSYCSGVDARTALVCSAIKADNITVYTVRLINGNATLLRNCASSASMYYSVSTASQLTDVFKSIAQSLSNLRISK